MSKNEFICDCNIIHQDVVDKMLKEMADEDLLNKLAKFFKILGDTTRVKILYALDKQEMCVCDIANVLGMSKSSISHQLSTLRQSGIVKYKKIGKEVFYMLDDEHVQQVRLEGEDWLMLSSRCAYTGLIRTVLVSKSQATRPASSMLVSVGAVALAGIILIMLLTKGLDVLLLGDDVASTVGVNTDKLKLMIIIVATLLTGIYILVFGILRFATDSDIAKAELRDELPGWILAILISALLMIPFLRLFPKQFPFRDLPR